MGCYRFYIMGRKFKPSKRHHGVRDPDKQRAEKEDKVKNKINQRPKNLDSQEVPRKMRELLNPVINKKRKAPKIRNNGLLSSAKFMNSETYKPVPGMNKPLRPIPVFHQKQGESQGHFFSRMHMAINEMKNQRKYEEKYNVQVVQDEHGNTKLVDQEPDILDDGKNDKKKGKKKKENTEKVKKLGKKERRKLKLKKNNAEEKDFDDFKDVAEFGDVVHRPPSLKFKIKKPEEKMSSSKVNGLLLKQKFEPKDGKKQKTPKVSMAKQVMLENERKRVVEAYRAMKDRAF